MLTPRQERILAKVVAAHLASGQPVASRTLAADAELDCGPSTVRNELALLEEHGLLAHPHTSAGRVPTDAGQRYVVDRMLAAGTALVPTQRLQLSLIRREVEEAMRVTTTTLSQVTDLLAIVSAPAASAATIRHVEVLALRPQVVMVVVITSTGGVSKLLSTFERPVDPGLISWAGAYLNERLGGMELGSRMLHQRLTPPGLGSSERAFLDQLSPAFDQLSGEREDAIYFDGTGRLMSGARGADISQMNDLMGLLEQRVALLALLRSALAATGVYVRIGAENELPALRSLAMVAAGYGLGARKLGAVSVIGPVRMDYATAISSVRVAARELSHFVSNAYAED